MTKIDIYYKQEIKLLLFKYNDKVNTIKNVSDPDYMIGRFIAYYLDKIMPDLTVNDLSITFDGNEYNYLFPPTKDFIALYVNQSNTIQ